MTRRLPANGAGPRRHLLLFIAGDEPNSVIALANLDRLCDNGCGDVDIEVVDVLEDASRAFEHRILVTPSLLQLEPGPRVLIIGNLSDVERVRSVLGLPPPTARSGSSE